MHPLEKLYGSTWLSFHLTKSTRDWHDHLGRFCQNIIPCHPNRHELLLRFEPLPIAPWALRGPQTREWPGPSVAELQRFEGNLNIYSTHSSSLKSVFQRIIFHNFFLIISSSVKTMAEVIEVASVDRSMMFRADKIPVVTVERRFGSHKRWSTASNILPPIYLDKVVKWNSWLIATWR